MFLLCFQEMNLKAEDIYLRKPEFLQAQDIEFWTEKEVPEQLSSVLRGWSCSCHGKGVTLICASMDGPVGRKWERGPQHPSSHLSAQKQDTQAQAGQRVGQRYLSAPCPLSPAGSVGGFPEAEGSLHGWVLSEVPPAAHCNRQPVSAQSVCHTQDFRQDNTGRWRWRQETR